MDDGLLIGVIGRPHGVHGALRVRSYSDETEHFRRLERVTAERDGRTRDLTVRDVQVTGRMPVLRFDGVETPEEARRLTGWELRVPRDQAAPLGPEEYYYADLIGLRVVSDAGDHGTVRAVFDAPQAPLLEVVPGSGRPALVPFMEVYVRSVSPERGEVVLEAPWIVDTE